MEEYFTIIFKAVDYNNNISLYSKKKVTAAAAVTENGPLINEKNYSFKNTKFGTQIAFLMKMCKTPSSKTNGGPAGGPHNLISSVVLYRLLSKFDRTFHWNIRVR